MQRPNQVLAVEAAIVTKPLVSSGPFMPVAQEGSASDAAVFGVAQVMIVFPLLAFQQQRESGYYPLWSPCLCG